MRACRRVLVAAGAIAAGSAMAVVPMLVMPSVAQAQAAEQIDLYEVSVVVQPSGRIHVQEVIQYDFGFNQRHGIFRNVPVRFRYDNRYDRVYDLHDVNVSASPGTPSDVELSESNNNKVIRIGNPDKTVSGVHTYTIDYDVDNAMDGFPDHDELYWNAIGTEWDVPIAQAQATVTVTAPAAVTKVACFAGQFRSDLPCDSAQGVGSTQATFAAADLAPNSGLTVVVGMPPGSVANAKPVLDERWSFGRAFELTPVTGGVSAGLLAGAIGFVGALIWRKGRDRQAVGAGVQFAPGLPPPATGPPGGDVPTEPVRPFADRAGPVEYRPPDDLRPAQLGVILDESADPLDVTATIVDLAVRGYLVIEELERPHMWSHQDWSLKQIKELDSALLPYESDLLGALFKGRSEVKLSELKDTFHSALVKVEGKLYDDAVSHGWFARRPDKTRSRWLVLGVLLTVAAVAAVVAVAATTHYGLVPVPLVLAGLVLAVGHRWMPARTAKGSAVLSRALGFRRYIDAAEAEEMKFAEQQNVFATYLPYAIVFGATKKWARAFAGLDGQVPDTGMSWYASPYPFQVAAFSSSIDSFTNSTSGIIVSTPSGGGGAGGSGFSGGFSGGGGGGGGGGSW